MGKLIDAEKLLEELCCVDPTEQWIHWDDIVDAVRDLPAAEPEIIRCKDCKYWGKRGLCEKWDYYISNEVFYYCGYAERRTDE